MTTDKMIILKSFGVATAFDAIFYFFIAKPLGSTIFNAGMHSDSFMSAVNGIIFFGAFVVAGSYAWGEYSDIARKQPVAKEDIKENSTEVTVLQKQIQTLTEKIQKLTASEFHDELKTDNGTDERERLSNIAAAKYLSDSQLEILKVAEETLTEQEKTLIERGIDLGTNWLSQGIAEGKIKLNYKFKGKKSVPLGGGLFVELSAAPEDVREAAANNQTENLNEEVEIEPGTEELNGGV